jgi:hypothetical protein
MKIRDANGRANAVVGPSGLSSTAKAVPPPAPSASAATDGVQLSNLALMAAAFHDSPGHIAKLSSLNATVSSGGYQVEAGVLSNSIIEASMRLSGGNYI